MVGKSLRNFLTLGSFKFKELLIFEFRRPKGSKTCQAMQKAESSSKTTRIGSNQVGTIDNCARRIPRRKETTVSVHFFHFHMKLFYKNRMNTVYNIYLPKRTGKTAGCFNQQGLQHPFLGQIGQEPVTNSNQHQTIHKQHEKQGAKTVFLTQVLGDAIGF